MSSDVEPPPPLRSLPGDDWEHIQLYRNVREAIASLPIYFRTETQNWQHVRKTQLAKEIGLSEGVAPYPNKSDHILDRPVADSGHNFGRLARTGLMDSYIDKVNDVNLCGIKAVHWREFLKIFQEGTTDVESHTALVRLKGKVDATEFASSEIARSALRILTEVERLLDANTS